MASDFTWFFALKPDERIALWRDPYGDCNGSLAVKLATGNEGQPGVYGGVPASLTDGVRWKLSPSVAAELSAIRRQLDQWWQSLDADQKAYIVENRGGELSGEYHDVVQAASLDPVTHAPHGHLVVIVSDNKTGRFRLPQMIRTYVEVKAAGGDPPAVGPQ